MNYRCFPHVINLAVQAIYAALKDGKGLKELYLLGQVNHIDGAAVARMNFPKGVTKDDYLHALEADVLGTARTLVTACRKTGKRREKFVDTILAGNRSEAWKDEDGNAIPTKILQLLRDCETRWSSTNSMTDRVLKMMPVGLAAALRLPTLIKITLGYQSIRQTTGYRRRQHQNTK